MKRILAYLLTVVMLSGILLNCLSTQVQALDFSQRKLSDKQIAEMLKHEPQKLRTEISTPADAIAFMNKKYPSLWMSYHLWQGQDSGIAVLRSGEDVLSDNTAGRSDVATMMAYLLCDDLNIGSIYGFHHASDGSFGPIMEANYIYADGKYNIFDPVAGMVGDKASRTGTILPNMTVSSLNDYAKAIAADSTLSITIDSLYAVKDGQHITFTDKDSWATIIEPSVQPFYANKSIADNKYAHILPENISKYKLPEILGGLTLSIDDAKELVGQSPKVIKAKVKTAGDLLIYMLAAKLKLKNGDVQVTASGHQWHYNDTANVTLSQNLGNCGRMANLANYLLEGDYDEIGFILHSYTGNNGGHVYNYIKYQGRYYIVDFSSYLFNNYAPDSEFNFISMDDLMDYSTRWNECYGGLAEIIAHTSPGTHLPNVWEGSYCYYPDNAHFTVIMQTPECQVSTLPCPPEVPDWRIIMKVKASPTSSNVTVNGKKVAFEAYNIAGNNYFKLRDIAMALRATNKKFEVVWDGKANAIKLTSGKVYSAVGNELKTASEPTPQDATLATSKVYLDGREIQFTAYGINGNNYFMLRDLGKALDFGVVYDGKTNTIKIDTNLKYTE